MKLIFGCLLGFIILLAPIETVAQKSSWYKISKADKLRSFGNIEKAVKKYDAILKEYPANPSANFQMGKIQLLDFEDYGKAEKHLSITVNNFEEKDTIYMAYYYLAETQKLLGNFPEAIENYEIFKARGVKDHVKSKNLIDDINTRIDECKLAQNYAKDSKYTFTRVINLGENVNSSLSEYCSIFFPDSEKLLYTARYQDSDNEKRFLDFKFYEGGYAVSDTNGAGTTPTRVNFNITDKTHFSVVSKTISGDSVIFYKDNKLWLSTMMNDELSAPEVLPVQVNRSYYQPHGAFSPDNKTFIFSSSDKNLQLDLYTISINDDNSWGEPVLLPAHINSKSNEDSPYISNDGTTLYFSSNKSGGFGNYDIYFSKWTDGEWGEPLNIGMPINSAGEDIFFSLNGDSKTGFLSSNRGGGYGAMDIYMFTEEPYPSFDCDEYLAANNNTGKNEIKVLDELVKNEMVRFDVTDAKIEGARISNVFWKVDDDILKVDNPMLTYTFKDTGVHFVSTQIYAKNKKTDSYEMDCSTQAFTISAEGPLFLEIEMDRMVKMGENTIVDAAVFYMGESKEITAYKWIIDDQEIDIAKQSYNYAFADTGYHDIKVIATIDDKANNEVTNLISTKRIFVYDESHNVQVVDNGDTYIPGIDLFDNKDIATGRINALKADVYGVPDDRRIFYSWYIDNIEVKGRQTELLAYDFKPLSTITVKAFIMHETEEPEFTLEASKIIPVYEDGVIASNQTNNQNTTDETGKTGNDIGNNNSGSDNKNVPVNVEPDPSVDANNNSNQTSKQIVTVDGVKYDIHPVYFMFDKYVAPAPGSPWCRRSRGGAMTRSDAAAQAPAEL
ncbi:MAG: hypothetical protein R3279_07100, partial [Putridiphycobacter sp.]|nr:hypothetical protein [Putridiphycobacter sp.]